MLTNKDVIEMLNDLASAFGSEEEEDIEKSMADLISVKEYVSNIGAEIDRLNEDLANVNEKNLKLRSANNIALRQIHQQEKAIDEVTEKAIIAKELTSLF